MNINKALLLALVLSIGLGTYLYMNGRQTDTMVVSDEKEKKQSTENLGEAEVTSYLQEHLSHASPSDADLDKVLEYSAIANEKGWLTLDQKLKYGTLKIETSPAPMEGIFILREILAKDSNHIATIETLGEMSIRSGQFEKAKERYQKLLSLQPENEDYQRQLMMICEKLGLSDCL